MAHADPLAPTEAIVSGTPAVLARRYATAFYELVAESKAIEGVAADVRILRNLERESAEFRALAHNPRLSRSLLVKAARQVAAAAALNPVTANFLGLLAKNRRLALLPAICDQFLDMLGRQRGEFMADVRTAKPLSRAHEEQLVLGLQALAGGAVRLAVREDKSLLGGLIVKLGSRLIDASVKGRLDRLERQLKSQTLNVKGVA